jgi:MFS family permease
MPSAYPRAEPGQRKSPFASLANTQFRWLYISNTAFFFAMMGQFVVRSYLAYDMTDSALALGMVNFAVAVPMLIISPFGGVIADRVERRNLIIIGQLVLVANEVIVLTLLVTGLLAFWHLMVVTFFIGCVFPFIMPARQAIVVNIIGRQGLTNAMALQMGGMNAARVVAPATSGFLIYLVDLKWTYFVAIVLYGIALGSMLQVKRMHATFDPNRKSMIHDILYGVRYVKNDPPVRALLLLGIVPTLLAMPFQSLLAVFAKDVWGMGEGLGLGLLNAGAGLGGVMGSFYVAMYGDTPRKRRLMMGSLIAFGVTLFAFASSPWFLLGLAFVLIADIFVNIFQTVNSTLIQMLIPDEVRGRVMSLMMMTFGLTPLGTVPIAAVAEAYGAPVAVGGACVVMIGLVVLFFALSRSLRDIDTIAHAAEAGEDGEPAAATTAIAAAAGAAAGAS